MTNTVNEALAFARAEHANPTQDWEGFCQRFVRSCFGIGPGFQSAWAQWLGADPEDKHVGGNPADAPVGSALCFKGVGPFGHIMPAAGEPKAWSNDLLRLGKIDLVDRTAPITQWGQTYLGWLSAINDVDLPVAKARKRPPRYRSVEDAIARLRVAKANARSRGDHDDAVALRHEIHHLKKLLDTIREN